jgi:SAM-dependent methyltransferase
MKQSDLSDALTFAPAMEDAQNYTKWMLEQFEGAFGRCVLEIGIGHGGYVDQMPASTRYVGLDIDRRLIDEAREKRPGVQFVHGDVTSADFVETFAPLQPDSILCVNVLEHIADDRRAVTNMLKTLTSGGHLLLGVPAFPFLYNDLDRLAGHCRRYTRTRLTEAIPGELGSVTRMKYFNAIGALGWFGNRFIRHRNIDSSAISRQVRIFDRHVLPIARIGDLLVGGLFGQSLIAVVRKS